jgi:hypothetical protein
MKRARQDMPAKASSHEDITDCPVMCFKKIRQSAEDSYGV